MRYQLFTRVFSRPFSPALPRKLLAGRRELVVREELPWWRYLEALFFKEIIVVYLTHDLQLVNEY